MGATESPAEPERRVGRRAAASPPDTSTARPASTPRRRAAAQSAPSAEVAIDVATETPISALPRAAGGHEVRVGRSPADVVAASTIAAARPHAQKAGRRASSASSDTAERPAGGRRAKAGAANADVVEHHVATASSTAKVVVGPHAPDGAAGVVAEPRVQDASGAVTGEILSTVTGVVTEQHVSTATGSITEVDVPEAAPVVKVVSRRALRAAAPVARPVRAAEPTSGPTSAATDQKADSAVSPASAPIPAPDRSAPTRSAPSGRRSRRGDIAKGTFSIIAMVFATGIAVATTMPASAFHAASDASSVTSVSEASAAVAVVPAQELTTSAEVAASNVSRDGYGVRDVAALRAAGYRIANTFTNNPNGAIQWPFPVGVPISDYFGHRDSPGGIGSTDHKGVDFTPGQGTPIQSVADGVVSFVQPSDNGGLGVHVIVDHVVDGQKVSSVYGHMLTGSIEVTEGQIVKVAQTVGRVGNTGTSTGAHLHLEIRLDGVTPVDPYAWLQTHAV